MPLQAFNNNKIMTPPFLADIICEQPLIRNSKIRIFRRFVILRDLIGELLRLYRLQQQCMLQGSLLKCFLDNLSVSSCLCREGGSGTESCLSH